MTTSHPGFVLFGPPHLAALALILAVAVGLPLLVRRWGSERLAGRLAAALAILLPAHELFSVWVRVGHYGLPWVDFLPVHLCGVATLLTAVMLIKRSFALYEPVYFWGLGGTLQAILTPDLERGFPEPMFVTYFTSHGLIIVGALYATLVFRFRPTFRSVNKVFLLTLAYAFLVVAPVNLALGTNYMYLCQKPAGATLLDHLGPWPWYIGGAAVVGWVSFVVYYSPFLVIDLFARRRRLAAEAG